MTVLVIGSEHGRPRDGVLVGHAAEYRLGFFEISISAMFGDLRVAVDEEFGCSVTLSIRRVEAR